MESEIINKAKRTDFRLVSIEETRNWRGDIANACGRIYGVYMYNANEHIYPCELAPSYSLISLYSYSEKEIIDEIAEEIMNGNSLCNDVTYVHVSEVDKLNTQAAPANLNGVYYKSGGRKYRNIMEFSETYLKCNRQV
ncbi:MAG: hypothetical protein WCP52_02135 [Bacteroidota bacterium]